VAMFFVLTGFTNCLKAIRLNHSGEPEKALSSLARAAGKRVSQFVLPASFATLFSWVLCEAGFFRLAEQADSGWILMTTPKQSPTLPQAFLGLFQNIVWTWTREHNGYDPVQWSLMRLLQSSMWVYLILLATIHASRPIRMLTVAGFYGYSWMCRDCKSCPPMALLTL
jgi:hypothetical protein